MFYQNKNIIPLTETQNRSNEETLFYSTIKELNALNLETTTSFSLMNTTLTNNVASKHAVDNFKVKKFFWFLKNPCFFNTIVDWIPFFYQYSLLFLTSLNFLNL